MKCNKKTCSSDILEFPTQYRKQMNMSNTHSTRKSTYSHLSATERGQMAAYLKMGKKAVEIAQLLGRHRSTICREIRRGSVSQVQDKNGKRTYFSAYFADSGNVSMKPIVKSVLISS